MIYGYGRIDRQTQRLTGIRSKLKRAGCMKIIWDKGRDRERLGWLLDRLQPGDIIVVLELLSVANSARDLYRLLARIEEKKAYFRSVKEAWISTVPSAEPPPDQPLPQPEPRNPLMVILEGISQFDRDVSNDRAARYRDLGRGASSPIRGAPDKLDAEQRGEVLRLKGEGQSVREIARIFGVSAATISRIKLENAPISKPAK
ncbi:recombinase family protein [Acidocella facilis]|uniref:recombinase family protein n=1 Tax=Acidocella facilis TaxID=525 RepID=UPI001F25AFF1|nr:recombinase family protein [Acidocella facilis]